MGKFAVQGSRFEWGTRGERRRLDAKFDLEGLAGGEVEEAVGDVVTDERDG